MPVFSRCHRLAVFIVLFVTSSVGGAKDWRQWRGPNRDGITNDFIVPQAWPKTLKEQWKVVVGEGHSSPVSADGKIYIHARQAEDEVVLCLDPVSGKEVWKSKDPVAYEMNTAAYAHGKGPKSTPVVGGGKLYTFGISGILSCFDAETGKVRWRKEFSKQYPSTSPSCGTAMSPVLDGGLLIAHVGGYDKGALTAFDAETGTVKWAYDKDGPAYSSPIVVTLEGRRQLVTYTQRDLIGVSLATGELLWKISAKHVVDTNSVTPVAHKDRIIYSGYEQGIIAIRPVKEGPKFAAKEVWRNPGNECYMNTPVLHGDELYGLSYRNKGQFFCVDAATGRTVWQSPGRMGENAAIVNAGGVLLLLTNDANLIVLDPNVKEYKPVAQYQVANSPTWAHPLILRDRILIKDHSTLTSFAITDCKLGA
jgi:outer membrane protein assembly factor BamB